METAEPDQRIKAIALPILSSSRENQARDAKWGGKKIGGQPQIMESCCHWCID